MSASVFIYKCLAVLMFERGELVSLSDLGTELGLSKVTVYSWLRKDFIPYSRINQLEKRFSLKFN